MTNVMATVSLLHEPPAEAPQNQRCSATRLFRGQPVLSWTLERLTRANRLGSIGIICWEDQIDAVRPLAEEHQAYLLAKGPRFSIPQVEAITAAQRWADGWRGGLLSTCHFDLGFHGPWHHELASKAQSEAVVLVDPASALIDPALIDDLILRAEDDPSLEFFFVPAAPGLDSALLRMPLLNRLAAAKAHPGRLLHYHPDQQCREMLGGPQCVNVPTSAARTLHRFTLDSDYQVSRISAATEALNGQLLHSTAEDLVARMNAHAVQSDLPREIVLELTTRRATRSIFSPGATKPIERPDFSMDQAIRLFRELSSCDGTRLTIAGVGDPLLCNDVFTIIDAARMEAGLHIHLETDLCDLIAEKVSRLATSPIDIVSVHLPALSPQTYARLMGRDAFMQVMDNLRALLTERRSRNSALPLVVPIFTKCRENCGEMEAWYDQWIRAVGSAVIRSPGTYGGLIPDTAQAQMTPPGRKPCYRLASRLTILSDGRVVSCEEDVMGTQILGCIGEQSLSDIWRGRFDQLRADHRNARWDKHPMCSRCEEWHRP